MLSYQHMYHAGGKMDIHKHIALCLAVKLLTQKKHPLFLLDAFAGRGIYNLKSKEAEKTQEAKNGFSVLKTTNKKTDNQTIHSLFLCIEGLNKKLKSRNCYPGSPYLINDLMRVQDKLTLCEIHPQEKSALLKNIKVFPKKAYLAPLNAYDALTTLLPPREENGLVLIDPSYEIKTEYDDIAKTTLAAYKQWPTGSFLIWYPILKNQLYKNLTQKITTDINNDESVYCHEWFFKNAKERALGSGLIMINPPQGFKEEMIKTFLFIKKLYQASP